MNSPALLVALNFDVYLFATHVILNGVSSKMTSDSDISLQGETVEVSIQSDVNIWRILSTRRKRKSLGFSEASPVVSEKDGKCREEEISRSEKESLEVNGSSIEEDGEGSVENDSILEEANLPTCK